MTNRSDDFRGTDDSDNTALWILAFMMCLLMGVAFIRGTIWLMGQLGV